MDGWREGGREGGREGPAEGGKAAGRRETGDREKGEGRKRRRVKTADARNHVGLRWGTYTQHSKPAVGVGVGGG